MRKIPIMIAFLLALSSIPVFASGSAEPYLPESGGVQLNWEYTETPPKRPKPKLLNASRYEAKWKIDKSLLFDLVQDENGVLYTSGSDNTVYAVYPNGKTKWTRTLDMGFELSVINLKLGLDGTLYAYSSDLFSEPRQTTIYALSSDGTIQWTRSENTIYSQFESQFTGDALGNFIYFTSDGLVSRNSKGELNWVNPEIATDNSSLSGALAPRQAEVSSDRNGNLYATTARQEIVSLRSDGIIRWRSEPQDYLDSYSDFRPYFSDAGLLYILSTDGLHALNIADGTQVTLTRQPDPADIRSSGIPTDGEGGFYIQTGMNIQKIDYRGNIAWAYAPRATEKYGMNGLDPLQTDDQGNVYFYTGVGNVIGLDPDGHETYAFLRNAFWHIIMDLVVGKNGNIYSTNMDIGLTAFGPKGIQVYLDNLYLPLSSAPVNENGTVSVPFRSLFESLGLTVDWDSSTRTITGTKEGLAIRLTLDSKVAYVNGEAKPLAAAPKLIGNATYVPLRFVGEALGKNVSWAPGSSSVNIDSIR